MFAGKRGINLTLENWKEFMKVMRSVNAHVTEADRFLSKQRKLKSTKKKRRNRIVEGCVGLVYLRLLSSLCIIYPALQQDARAELEPGEIVSGGDTPPCVVLSPFKSPRFCWAPERSGQLAEIPQALLDEVRTTIQFGAVPGSEKEDEGKKEEGGHAGWQDQDGEEEEEKRDEKEDGDRTKTGKEEEEEETASLSASLMVVVGAVVTRRINEVVRSRCYGCQHDRPGQMDHVECLWRSWSEIVDDYFDEAIRSVSETDLIGQLRQIYHWEELFEEDRELLVVEMVEFFHFQLGREAIQKTLKKQVLSL
ncbi:uncharacterized protein [Diadema antillarum]|uniref:uncharacterized protein n=1 Tax=Diadema antillarum TaxID=105358 RepID=UPI003A855F56